MCVCEDMTVIHAYFMYYKLAVFVFNTLGHSTHALECGSLQNQYLTV